jgi:hypothetical protein
MYLPMSGNNRQNDLGNQLLENAYLEYSPIAIAKCVQVILIAGRAPGSPELCIHPCMHGYIYRCYNYTTQEHPAISSAFLIYAT